MKNTFIGAAVERIEDLRFLRGMGQYADDLTLPGVLYAAILRSSVAHGRVRAIDTKVAATLPGVRRVLTAAELGEPLPTVPLRLWPLPELEPFGQPALARDKVRYVGEAIAVVLADSKAQAEDALEAIAVDIESLPAISNTNDAEKAAALLFEQAGSNRAIVYTAEKGKIGEAFAGAEYTRRERFAVQRHLALPMEPRGIMAAWDENKGRMTVYGAAKVPFANRRILARLMGLAEDAVDVLESDVGGGFGARGEFFPEDFLIPYAARLMRRPVKWIEDRREHLMTMGHAREMDCDIEIACRRDGTILGLRGSVRVDEGAYMRTVGTISPRNVAQFMSGPYRVPAIHLQSSVMLTNKAPIGTYRGPGRYEGDFFRERLFDIVARDLGLDPIEFRRRNLVRADEMPFPLAKLTPPEKREELDSGDHPAALARCLDEFKWSEKLPLQGRLIDGRYHGLAVGCFIEGGAAGPSENAKLALERDGSVTVYVGSTSVGQGVETSLSQIAADALEMPLDRIRMLHGSTTYLTDGYGSYHSRATVMGGSAILLAAEKLRDMLRAAAAWRLGCTAAEVTLSDETAIGPHGQKLRFADLAEDGLAAEEKFSNHHHTYAYGSAAAHVAVDPGSGRVELLDYVMVEDAGRIVNPLVLQGQAVGAVVQGLGGAFLEHLIYDEDGQLLTGSLADYLIPAAGDFPRIRAVMLQLHPSPNNPLGVKGAGEGGTIPVGGLMANAIAAALSSLGVEPHELPLSPPRIWKMIEEAKARRRG
jgi:aerobic carbon-monoxide dehydrogenase large subunit